MLWQARQGLVAGRGALDAAPAAGGGSAAYTVSTAFQNDGGVGNTWTQAVNIGTASATRLIVIALVVQNDPAITMSVAGTSVTNKVSGVGGGMQHSMWWGVVPAGSGSQNVVVTGGNFLRESMVVWSVDGLTSNTPRATYNVISSNAAVFTSVNAGDFIFVAQGDSTFSYPASTETPAHTVTNSGLNSNIEIAALDWTVAAPAASFTAAISAVGGSIVGATFR